MVGYKKTGKINYTHKVDVCKNENLSDLSKNLNRFSPKFDHIRIISLNTNSVI